MDADCTAWQPIEGASANNTENMAHQAFKMRKIIQRKHSGKC